MLATKVVGVGKDYIPALRRLAISGQRGTEQPSRLTRAQIHEALEASLKRLRTVRTLCACALPAGGQLCAGALSRRGRRADVCARGPEGIVVGAFQPPFLLP